jgi:hypothetical protein
MFDTRTRTQVRFLLDRRIENLLVYRCVQIGGGSDVHGNRREEARDEAPQSTLTAASDT